MGRPSAVSALIVVVLSMAACVQAQITIEQGDVAAWPGNTYLYTGMPNDSLPALSLDLTEGATWDFSGVQLSDTFVCTMRSPNAEERARFPEATDVLTMRKHSAAGVVPVTMARALSLGTDSLRHVGSFTISASGTFYDVTDGGSPEYSIPLPAQSGMEYTFVDQAEDYWVKDRFGIQGIVRLPGGESVTAITRRYRMEYTWLSTRFVDHWFVWYSKEYGIVAMAGGMHIGTDSTYFRPGTTVDLQEFWSNTAGVGREFWVKVGVGAQIGVGGQQGARSMVLGARAGSGKKHNLLGRRITLKGSELVFAAAGLHTTNETVVVWRK
ncbi:MAG: hypothetical protein GF331_13240 [Chitinivibrionales bacterium]|nr:hypothetical protein [Chitinivibrionales bacterium]